MQYYPHELYSEEHITKKNLVHSVKKSQTSIAKYPKKHKIRNQSHRRIMKITRSNKVTKIKNIAKKSEIYRTFLQVVSPSLYSRISHVGGQNFIFNNEQANM